MNTPSEKAAALTVADKAQSVADCRELLDMLGLLPEDRSVPDTSVVGVDLGLGHGRFRMYLAGCRCNPCRAKNAEMKRKARAKAQGDPSRADRAGHGKANTYKNHGCRCAACCEAHSLWMRNYQARRREAS